MKNAHGRDGKIAAAKYSHRRWARRHIVGVQFVAALFPGRIQLAEIPVNTTLFCEEIRDKLRGRGHEIISQRTIDGERACAIFKPGRLDERSKVAAVIDMEVSEQNHVEL